MSERHGGHKGLGQLTRQGTTGLTGHMGVTQETEPLDRQGKRGWNNRHTNTGHGSRYRTLLGAQSRPGQDQGQQGGQ